MSGTRSYPKLYLIGDSLTQRAVPASYWAQELQERYIRKCDIINRGFSGYTSRMLVQMLPEILQQETFNSTINIAVILIGSNDSVLPELDKRAVPVEEYGTNLNNLIGLCKQKFSTVVIVTLPPQDEVRWDEHSRTTKNIPGCLSNEHASHYADKCLEVAEKNSIECIDLYHNMMRTPDWKELFFCDGIS